MHSRCFVRARGLSRYQRMANSSRWYWVPLVAISVFGVLAYFAKGPITSPWKDVRAERQVHASATPFVGTPSCSARGCHGSIEPDADPARCQQNEYTQWMRDLHADAFRTLFN